MPSIKILDPLVAQRIAAGEVIDRPSSLLRELLDNALDAKSQQIIVTLREGGREEVRVVDDGCGMSKEDLRLCWLSHATSKIRSSQDLENLTMLGFRGEALASVAACCRLSIITTYQKETHRLVAENGSLLSLEPHPGSEGTIISAQNLFAALPARRKFLKRASAETSLCQSILLEKALAFPKVAFKLFLGDSLKLFLPPDTPQKRIEAAYQGLPSLSEVKGFGEGFEVSLFLSNPEFYRRDRRFIQIFVNGRLIDQPALTQSIQYGFDNFLAGGLFPICFLFITINPTLIDFNIHPSKKEIRFKDLASLRYGVIRAIRGFLDSQKNSLPSAVPSAAEHDNAALNFPWPTSLPPSSPSSSLSAVLPSAAPSAPSRTTEEEQRPLYLGQVMGLFLICEYRDKLLLVDQHAAHERVIFDRLRRGEVPTQKLLIPYEISLEETEERYWLLHQKEAHKLGIELERLSPGHWILVAIPSTTISKERWEKLLKNLTHTTEESFEKELFAQMACHSAIREGDPIDGQTALQLIKDALSLSPPRCPHGRPLWITLEKEKLWKLIGRKI